MCLLQQVWVVGVVRVEPALMAYLASLMPTCTDPKGSAAAAVQGVICFESTMAEAEAAGIVREGVPVVCKPTPQVSSIVPVVVLHRTQRYLSVEQSSMVFGL